MANKSILTNYSRFFETKQTFFSPVAVLPGPDETPICTTYCFLSRVLPWEYDTNPPEPLEDQRSLKNIYKNIFAIKKITSDHIRPVIYRIDWKQNTVYDYYREDVNMTAKDVNGNPAYRFYVKNRYDQIFKCLWNNNGLESVDEPFFRPGSYGTNNIFQSADGYKWKYMYTIDQGSKSLFMDDTWIPVPALETNTFNPLDTSGGCGDIEVINVVSGGSNYDPANAVITIEITGDGHGATANATVSNGVITDIIVANPGSNYTYANVEVRSTLGSGAILDHQISPIGGHAYDVATELGANHAMLTCEFEGSEGGVIPTDIDYHQTGLLLNPTSLDRYPLPADGSIYSTTTDLVVAPGFGQYVVDEFVYQGATLEEAYLTGFVGTVLSFDAATNVVRLINITGTPKNNAPVYGDTSKTVRTLLSVSTPNLVTFSGYIIYLENISSIQRSDDGIEQFKFILGY